MRLLFDVSNWVRMRKEEGYTIFTTSDGSGNEIELRFDNEDFFTKRHLKSFIKMLEELKEDG